MSRVTRDDKVRKERIPVASSRAPLMYRGLDRKNFHQRWVLDRDDRIQRFLEAGYEFVKQTSQGTFVGESTVDSGEGLDTRVKRHGSQGKFLYLMQIKKEWYDADQAAKQKEIDELEETMRTPKGSKDKREGVEYGNITFSRKNLNDILSNPERE